MPTREEIVKALRCTGERACAGCAYDGSPYCVIESGHDAADLIEKQARQIKQLTESLLLANVNFEHAKHERDAAIADLYKAKSCNTCAKQYKDDCLLEECMEPCSTFAEGSVPYKWRGVKEEP